MPFAHRITALLLLAWLSAPRVAAQSVDPRLYDASLSPGALIGLDSAWIPSHLQGFVGFGVTYANDELVLVEDDEDPEHTPLNTRWITTLAGGFGLFDRVELQLGLTLHKVGELPARDPTGEERLFGIGDVRVAVRGLLLDPEDSSNFGLVIQLGLFVPSGGEAPFSGDDGVVFDPRLVLDWRSDGGIALALQLGYRARPERRVFDLSIDDEVRYGIGAELPMAALGSYAPLSFVAELEGAVGLFGGSDIAGQGRARQGPLEARLGVRLFGARWALTVGAGAGLNDGYGAPDFRFVANLTLSPGPLDGPRPPPRYVTSAVGEPPTFAEPPALSDEGVFDAALADDPDADGDRVIVPADQCPNEAEDMDGFEDEDGCPEPDNDADGVLDGDDQCPTDPETPNGIDDHDGCPDEGESSVVTRDGIIEIEQTIEFHSGSDVLLPSATPILAQVAAVLKANQQIKRVRIEGHTDGEGDEEMNVDLSERRAASVRRKLIELDVAGERLLPKGYGATRPVASNRTPEGRKKNRRVEFRVIDPPPEGSPRLEPIEEPK